MTRDVVGIHARTPRQRTWAQVLDRHLAGPMFFLSVLFLAIVAGLIHRIGHVHLAVDVAVEAAQDPLPPPPVGLVEEAVILWSLVVLWPLFLIDGVVRLRLSSPPAQRTHRWWLFALTVLFPPVRLAGRSYQFEQLLWLPWQGWQRVSRTLRRRLERFFSVPMIVIALMILPLLAVEYFWKEKLRDSFSLALAFDLGTAIIWLAFALEFIIMISVAPRRWTYAFANWMDMAVVLLPLLDYLPILRLLRAVRLLELGQLGKLGRLYRLRGLMFKLWRAALLLGMLQKLLGQNKEKRLARLKELRTAKEEEMADLLKEITALEGQLERERTNKA
jgi:voltage-gated potassium channel